MIGRCYLRELERRRALRDRVAYGGVLGAALACVLLMGAWLAVFG